MVSLPIMGEGRGEGLYILDDLDTITSQQLDRAIASLPEWRREKALRFKHEQGRKECAFAYLLLCQALQEVYGITEQLAFTIGEHGKPALSFPSSVQSGFPALSPSLPPLPHFNLSHCRDRKSIV